TSLANKEGLAEVFYQRGRFYDSLNLLERARVELDRGMAHAQSLAGRSQQVKVMLQQSANSLSANKIAQAQREVTDALELATTERLDSLKTLGQISLANIFFQQGDYSHAETLFKQAQDSARAYGGQYNLALAQAGHASLRQHQGWLDEAQNELNL